jgi:hypothetical protein
VAGEPFLDLVGEDLDAFAVGEVAEVDVAAAVGEIGDGAGVPEPVVGDGSGEDVGGGRPERGGEELDRGMGVGGHLDGRSSAGHDASFPWRARKHSQAHHREEPSTELGSSKNGSCMSGSRTSGWACGTCVQNLDRPATRSGRPPLTSMAVVTPARSTTRSTSGTPRKNKRYTS